MVILLIYIQNYKIIVKYKCHHYANKMENILEAADSKLVHFYRVHLCSSLYWLEYICNYELSASCINKHRIVIVRLVKQPKMWLNTKKDGFSCMSQPVQVVRDRLKLCFLQESRPFSVNCSDIF